MSKKSSTKKLVPRGPRPRKPLIRFAAPVTRKSMQIEIDEANLARLDSYLNFVENTVGVRVNYSDLLNQIIPVFCVKDRVYSAYMTEQTRLKTHSLSAPVVQPVMPPKPLGASSPAAPITSDAQPLELPSLQTPTHTPTGLVALTPSQATMRPSLKGGSGATETEKPRRFS